MGHVDLITAATTRISALLPEGVHCGIDWCPGHQRLKWKTATGESPLAVVGCSFASLPALRIVVFADDPAVAKQLANKTAFYNEIRVVVNRLAPVDVVPVVLYDVPVAGIPRAVEIAALGELHLGTAIVFEEAASVEHLAGHKGSQLINQIIQLVNDKCAPETGTWEKDLRESLADLFEEPFRDGQIITAQYLNQLEARLKYLETIVEKLTEGGQSSTETFVIGGNK